MLENYVVALPCVHIIDYDDAAGIDIDQSAADVARFLVPFKCEVYRAGLIVSETCGGSTQGQIKFDKRPTVASDTNRTDGTIGHFYMGTTAAGKMLYDAVGAGEILVPGEEVIVEIAVQATGGSPAGHVLPVLLVKPISETIANLTNMVATA